MEVQQDLTVSMEGLTEKSLKFLSKISRELYYRTTQYVKNPIEFVYEGCMEELLSVYKKYGFNVTRIHCDN